MCLSTCVNKIDIRRPAADVLHQTVKSVKCLDCGSELQKTKYFNYYLSLFYAFVRRICEQSLPITEYSITWGQVKIKLGQSV